MIVTAPDGKFSTVKLNQISTCDLNLNQIWNFCRAAILPLSFRPLKLDLLINVHTTTSPCKRTEHCAQSVSRSVYSDNVLYLYRWVIVNRGKIFHFWTASFMMRWSLRIELTVTGINTQWQVLSVWVTVTRVDTQWQVLTVCVTSTVIDTQWQVLSVCVTSTGIDSMSAANSSVTC